MTATDGRPVRLPEPRTWTDATDLIPGRWLRTGSGTHVRTTPVTATPAVHNLTIDDVHTYGMPAGHTLVAVQNSD